MCSSYNIQYIWKVEALKTKNAFLLELQNVGQCKKATPCMRCDLLPQPLLPKSAWEKEGQVNSQNWFYVYIWIWINIYVSGIIALRLKRIKINEINFLFCCCCCLFFFLFVIKIFLCLPPALLVSLIPIGQSQPSCHGAIF